MEDMGNAEIKHYVEGKRAVWEYERLCVLAQQGKLEIPLNKIGSLYEGELQISPVMAKGVTDCLATFLMTPPVSVFIVREKNGEATITTRSLNGKASRQLLDTFEAKTAFVPYEPDAMFIAGMECTVGAAVLGYGIDKRGAKKFGMDIEKIFGAGHYANFLAHLGFSKDESVKKALAIYGLKK